MSPRLKADRQARIILVLGDQLSPRIAALRHADKDRDTVLLAEVEEETKYVGHHKKKLAFVLAAMRHFASELQQDGWRVDYVMLDAPGNTGSIVGELKRAAARHQTRAILATAPGEWRLARALEDLDRSGDLDVERLDDDRFLCSVSAFASWIEGRKAPRMEHFYRHMRRKTGLLMHGDAPEGGRWNFDADNRKPPGKMPPAEGPRQFEPDSETVDVLDLVRARFPGNFGELEPFWFGVTREQAELAFEHFVSASLPHFGDYQDAMLRNDDFLFHAVVSLYLNIGLLDPLEVCRRVEAAYRQGDAPLNAAEGFVRQVIGWREYVRGIYCLKMPGYAERNQLRHQRPLPDFYWTGDTDMACIATCVRQTRDEAYAHHIQRLMITGNFALLAGVDPHAVHEWYLAVYADAVEWVELPNTLGMSQFADGGLLASKPYAASANYINRMSDYCRGCRYDARQRSGADACPFNFLYWDFLARHRRRLKGNPRLAPLYRTWDRMDAGEKRAVRSSAARFLKRLAG